jgi:hypothetical protein
MMIPIGIKRIREQIKKADPAIDRIGFFVEPYNVTSRAQFRLRIYRSVERVTNAELRQPA